MANLRNEFEFRSALLTALGQEHTEAEAKNEEMWRRKMLDGLGVEYDQNDVNQFGLFREKLIEGVTNYSGGGGSSDFSTAQVTMSVNNGESFYVTDAVEIIDNEMLPSAGFESGNYTLVLYKGSFEGVIEPPSGYRVSNATSTGGITITQSPLGGSLVNITGDGTLTVELTLR